ncbi:DUF1156 domain-containing protein [bacterium]|nr:DUF1156 domain-containing protein [bacterium]
MTNHPTECKKLIEVAMPIKEISAESVRDKSIRHGHISTLHLWWARRPLPVCRAVVFTSLVPDPLDEKCPQAFREAVDALLGKEEGKPDYYKPYENIPFTATDSAMEDNPRNRLLMFIGKFSSAFLENEKRGKKTPAKDQLSEGSLIKWDNKNDETILKKARKLIWVAHDPEGNTLESFDEYYKAIKKAEKELYQTPNRHLETEEVVAKENLLQQAIDAFLDRMPKVFDPFAGGGAIPLEAARLGCRSYGNDINPVAHIIQKGSLEFPQKYGKPIVYTRDEFIRRYGPELLEKYEKDSPSGWKAKGTDIYVENRLAFDVEYFARKLIQMTEEEVGHLYPMDDKGNMPIAYYWVWHGRCLNPSCRANVPLLRQFYLCKKDSKAIHLSPVISGKEISFEIKEGKCNIDSWVQRKNLKCPICGNVTSINELKRQFNGKEPIQKLVAVFEENTNGKTYRTPNSREIEISNQKSENTIEILEKLAAGNSRDLHCTGWGVKTWGDLFSNRQLSTLNAFVKALQQIKQELNPLENDYDKVILTYLGILMDRIAVANTSFGVWHTSRETLERPMGRQAIPMVFDYPESNPFCHSSGSAYNQLDWLTRYIQSESGVPYYSVCNNSSSGEVSQFDEKSIDCVVTDPPYYDAIAYADLSDFFYVWLKRTLSDLYPLNFAFPQTPKSEECTALKHHHSGNLSKANDHFENKLKQIFDTIEKQTAGIVSIMFAHQSTQAWTTLCNSILSSRMNITGSWANETEMTGALKKDKAFLASSITVACKPFEKSGFGDFKVIKKDIDAEVKKEVGYLYKLGFRGADLLTACFGQAVSEFGKYEKVEKADGTEVTVAELLETARDAAFNAIISDIQTDDMTRFYIGWLNLFSFVAAEHDDVRRITQIGLNIDVNDLMTHNILLREGNRESLAGFEQRNELNRKLGDSVNSPTIDKVHKAMFLFDRANRGELLKYIAKQASDKENPVWRVLNSLVEILPNVTADFKQASGLLANKDSLINDAKQKELDRGDQTRF